MTVREFMSLATVMWPLRTLVCDPSGPSVQSLQRSWGQVRHKIGQFYQMFNLLAAVSLTFFK
eukprot:4958847-Amphidinium_carterae.1